MSCWTKTSIRRARGGPLWSGARGPGSRTALNQSLNRGVWGRQRCGGHRPQAADPDAARDYGAAMELDAELTVRLGAALAVFAAMSLWEALAPRRIASVGRAPRWPSNIAIVVLDALLVRILIPVAAVGVAVIAAQRGWGLLNITRWPPLLEGLLGFLALDLAIYAQHVAFHKVPWLWRSE